MMPGTNFRGAGIVKALQLQGLCGPAADMGLTVPVAWGDRSRSIKQDLKDPVKGIMGVSLYKS